jgi:hypothetical protein
MKKIDDKIYVRVYLDGELPAGFRKLRESTRQLLEEIRFYSGKKLEFTFLTHYRQKMRKIRKIFIASLSTKDWNRQP